MQQSRSEQLGLSIIEGRHSLTEINMEEIVDATEARSERLELFIVERRHSLLEINMEKMVDATDGSV